MNIGECYQILGLSSNATISEVKSSYRRLARQYHPDVNPGNSRSQEQFIQINQAYQNLIHWLAQNSQQIAGIPAPPSAENSPTEPRQKSPQPAATNPTPQATNQSANFQHHPNLSEFEKLLKQRAYVQLQQLLKYQRFARAIALVEGLVQRIPQDTEVRQWQAITYQRMGRYLIDMGEFEKAQIYLKKAIKTDPLNRSLLSEIQKDFWRLQTLVSS
jgi:tetratricopeptide (TPR) repeat protein